MPLKKLPRFSNSMPEEKEKRRSKNELKEKR
jgi:hypothetical protein